MVEPEADGRVWMPFFDEPPLETGNYMTTNGYYSTVF